MCVIYNKDKLPPTAPRQRRAPDGSDVARERPAVVERDEVHHVRALPQRDPPLGVGRVRYADVAERLGAAAVVEDEPDRPVVDRELVAHALYLSDRVVLAADPAPGAGGDCRGLVRLPQPVGVPQVDHAGRWRRWERVEPLVVHDLVAVRRERQAEEAVLPDEGAL